MHYEFIGGLGRNWVWYVW